MISRIALAAGFVASAAGAVLAVRSERTRDLAKKTYKATSERTRNRATRAAERIDLMIRDMETSDEENKGTDWRYQTLVGARDALVTVGHTEDNEPEPVGASSNGSLSN